MSTVGSPLLAALAFLLSTGLAQGQSGLDEFISESAILNAPCPISLSVLQHWSSPTATPSAQAQVLAAYIAGFSDGLPSSGSSEMETNKLISELRRLCTSDLREAARELSAELSEEVFTDGVERGFDDARSERDYLEDRPSKWQ
jgi:hypothetical protein